MEHPFVLSICAFLMLMVLLTWVGYRVFYKPGRFLKQLGTPVITDEKAQLKDSSEPEASTLVTLLHQIGSRMPSSDAEAATLRTDLIRAGFRSENAAPVFYGIRIVSTFGMLIVCLMMDSNMPPNPMMKVALLVFGCCTGWILPRFFLEKKVKARRKCSASRCPMRWICWWSRWKPGWAWTRPFSTWPASFTSAIRN